MADLSATRLISKITTQLQSYWVMASLSDLDYFDRISVTEKSGDMAYIIWYQLWRDGQVVKEINSLYVVEIEYAPIDDETVTF